MLARQTRCRRASALYRLPSLYHNSLQSSSSTGATLTRQSELLPSQPSLPVLPATRRLLTTRQTLRPWRRRSLQTANGYLPERYLATAVASYDSSYRENTTPGLPPSPNFRLSIPDPNTPLPLWELRSQDVSHPLLVCDPPEKGRRQRLNTLGIPGHIEENIPMFQACLQVGKLDRAGQILRRISKSMLEQDLDPIEYHNSFFRATLDHLKQDPASKLADNLHKFFELQIHAPGIEPTVETIAYLVKASLLTTKGSRLERLITRYMGFVPGDAGLPVLYMEQILTPQDRNTVNLICKEYNLISEPVTQATPTEDDADVPFESAAMTNQSSPLHAEEFPPVLETPQKSMGLANLQDTLSFFSTLPEGADVQSLSWKERREIQSALEHGCVDAAIKRWKQDNENLRKMGMNTSLGTASLNPRLYEWQLELEAFIKRDLDKVEASEASTSKGRADSDRCIYGTVLKQSTPSRLAAVTILSVLSALALKGVENGVSLSHIVMSLAKLVQQDIALQQGVKVGPDRYKASPRLRGSRKSRLERHSTGQVESEGHVVDPAQFLDTSWSVELKTKVGAILLTALLQTAKIDVRRQEEGEGEGRVLYQRQAAFTRMTQFKQGKKTGMIIANQALITMMNKEPRGEALARHLPMVVEPLPWKEFDKGGYLEYSTPLLRTKNNDMDQAIYAKAALARGDMDQVTKGLDVLGKTAWRINNKVFNVMLEVWNTGEAFAGLPPLEPNLEKPAEPSSQDPVERAIWKRKMKIVQNEEQGLLSVRCYMNLQMEIARSFRDQTFYFPHNLDFRGRAYPMSTYLNHMGADNTRGLLLFAKGKELGEEGLRWVKVQLANVYGFDKASFEEREAFTDENLDNVLDSANDPIKGKRWWLKAEDPWQCLAACYELKAALESPDPTKFISHLPVHQDGTCNGLQHYAALGGDSWGAQQVNLAPGERPSDVYSAVADVVRASIVKEAGEGVHYATLLKDKITRKVVKQTVMTNVYGVTFEGARRQVRKQLDDLYGEFAEKDGIDNIQLSYYIAKKIFVAMGTMFRGAHDIQYWLGEAGSRICTALLPDQIDRVADGSIELKPKALPRTNGARKNRTAAGDLADQMRQTIVWTTPLRMPVAQPYRKNKVRSIQTCMQDLVLQSPDRLDPVDKRKQLQAFPPNFIHSLDASHMLLSALQCDEMGLTFAAVHDSFWTHACDIKAMSKALRDSFVRIHREDVIGRLNAEFHARYRGAIHLDRIPRAAPAGKAIMNWREANKMSMKEELIVEKKRQDLLKSDDPELVEQGKNMVTPASIHEELAEPWQSKMAVQEVGIVGLGELPKSEITVTEAKEMNGHDELGSADDDLAATLANASALDDPMGELAADEESLAATEDAELLEEEEPKAATKKKSATPIVMINVWLPLTFPKIPAKGDFDVSVLKGSDYFFS